MIRKIALAVSFIFILACSSTNSVEPIPFTPVPESAFREVVIPSVLPTPVPTVETTPVPTVKSTPKPTPKPKPSVKPTPRPTKPPVSKTGWRTDNNISWYGPGFYGKRTACGKAYTKTILGVAHRSLPCGTLVSFRYKGKVVTVPVIDRGPYVAGRIFDMSGGLCVYLNHCFTGSIEYKIGRP